MKGVSRASVGLSMSYLPNNRRKELLASVAGATGVGAYALPLAGSLHLLLLTAAGITLVLLTKQRVRFATLLLAVWGAVLTLHLSAPIAVAAVSAAAVSLAASPFLGVAILLVHTSLIATLQEGLANTLSWVHLESVGPAAGAVAVLWLARVKEILFVVMALTAALISGWIATHSATSPHTPMALAALPACCFAGVLAWRTAAEGKTERLGPLLTVVIVVTLTWTQTLPRNISSQLVVLMPEASDTFEAKFFNDYAHALQFAGFNATVATRPDDIPPRSLVILPWLTQPLGGQANQVVVRHVGELARQRRWTLIVAGEHTNLGGVAEQIQTLSRKSLLRRDLTVPPSNSDNSGPLRVADLRGWLHDAILNRGASVQIGSLFDRILLAGDGWWAEPDIGEWLWLGDYVWQSKDRAGRLALAAAIEFEGARWIVIGDNSPFINSQVIADPRALIRIIELASLWPTLATDLLLVLVGGALSFAVCRPHWQPHLQFFAVSILLTAAIAGAYLSMAPGTKWSDVYVGESGHDPRNFNVTLAAHPELLKHGRMLRFKHALAGKHSLPKGRVVIFMLVDGAVELDGIKLSNCRRLGSLATGEGIYLMDAQACRADGSAMRVLIGDQNNAAVLAIQRDDGEAIIVLDTAFLSRNAPAGNVKWLLSKMDQ